VESTEAHKFFVSDFSYYITFEWEHLGQTFKTQFQLLPDGHWFLFSVENRKAIPIWELNIKGGLFFGIVRQYSASGTIFQELSYNKRGKLDGYWIQVDTLTGHNLGRTLFQDGKLINTISYYPGGAKNRKKSERMDTFATSWHENGVLSDSTQLAKGGGRNGISKGWHKNGRLRFEGKFDYGYEIGTWKYYSPDGKIDSMRVFPPRPRQPK